MVGFFAGWPHHGTRWRDTTLALDAVPRDLGATRDGRRWWLDPGWPGGGALPGGRFGGAPTRPIMYHL